MRRLHRTIRAALLVVATETVASQTLPRPELFNHGRTRNFRGASQTRDGLELYVSMRGPDRTANGSFRDHVGVSRYQDGRWSEPTQLQFFDHATSDRDPVVTPDGRRLYFSSTGAPGAREATGFRVWYVDRTPSGWSAPVFADSLNQRADVSVTAVTADGSIYLVAGDTGAPASFDVYRASAPDAAPRRVDEWTSAAGEAWAAVDPSGEFAIVARSPSIDSLVLLVTARDAGGNWSPLRPLQFDGANWLRPYDYRFPFFTHDRSALVLTSATRLFHLPTRALFPNRTLPPARVLSVPSLAAHEPEIFFPLDLRTTNGIAFTPDMRTVYLSQYTERRDERGRRSITVLESHRSGSQWSRPTPVSLSPANSDRPLEEYHPVLSPDARTLYFNSRRQADGSIGTTNDLWRVSRSASGALGAPEPVRHVATPSYDDYASIATDGSLYFRSDRPGGAGGGDIYVARMVEGVLHPPIALTVLNSADNENDLTVSRDQRLIIFNRYVARTNEIDLFVSVHEATGAWSTPRPLTALNTVVDWELTPTLSPDGRHLYVEVSGALVRWRLDSLLTESERARVR